MIFHPRLIAFFIASLISALTTTFLSFVSGATNNLLFVAAVSSFAVAFFLILYALELLIFREVNKIYTTIRKLKIKDFDISRKSLIKNSNPFRKLNDEIFVYVAKKQKEIDELKELEQFRREFLADVSHELKTPIFAAQGFIHTLIDGAVDDVRVRDKFLGKAAKSLDGLDALVKDLVALSEMETGAIKMHLEPVDIHHITIEIFEQLERLAVSKKITLRIRSDLAGPVSVKADAQRIVQVMTNLIENAIKYGHESGKVQVEFTEVKKHVVVNVTDDGPGIPLVHINRIFERFYRVDKSRSKEKGGTGLGLAIVKHIVNAHGSKITVMSKIDKGTTFTFKLDKTTP